MSEALTGLIQQTFQQTMENQAVKSQTQTASNKGSFESYLQQEQPTQQTQTTGQISGVQLDGKLEQIQAELAQKIKVNGSERLNPNDVSKDLLDNKSRMGLMKEAYSKLGDTSSATGGFEGRMVQAETEFKEVEALMKSDNKLSPGELLALQARLYQVSQHIEVMSKVVDQMAGGIKTVLNTNI